MDSFLPFEISASALSTQRLRMALISSNLANVHTTETPEGGVYRRKDLVVSTTTMPEFEKALRRRMAEGKVADRSMTATLAGHLRGVKPVRVVSDTREPLVVHAPWHPEADANGNVQMPNISVMEEMVNMIAVSRAYEANLAVLKTTKTMINQALEIGR